MSKDFTSVKSSLDKKLQLRHTPITKKIDEMSSGMRNIMEDKELVDALKRVTIGLSKLFDDIYP